MFLVSHIFSSKTSFWFVVVSYSLCCLKILLLIVSNNLLVPSLKFVRFQLSRSSLLSLKMVHFYHLSFLLVCLRWIFFVSNLAPSLLWGVTFRVFDLCFKMGYSRGLLFDTSFLESAYFTTWKELRYLYLHPLLVLKRAVDSLAAWRLLL